MTALLEIVKEYFNDKRIILNLDKFKILLENDIIDINKSTIDVEYTNRTNDTITILNYFCDVYNRVNILGNTNVDEIINIWIDKKIDLCKDFGLSESPVSLIYKICNNKEEITQLIVKSGFSFKDFKLPILYIHTGRLNHNLEIAKAIIKFGYDINNIPANCNPIYKICVSKLPKNGHLTVLLYLLQYNNNFDKQYNPLKEAIINEHNLFVKILLESGACLPSDYKTENEEINEIIKEYIKNNSLVYKNKEIKLNIFKNIINSILFIDKSCYKKHKEIKLSILKNIINRTLLIDKSCYKSINQYDKFKEYQDYIENFKEQKIFLNYDALENIYHVFSRVIKENKYIVFDIQYFEILERVLSDKHHHILLINDEYDYLKEIKLYDLKKRIKMIEGKKEESFVYEIIVIPNYTNLKDKKHNNLKNFKIKVDFSMTLDIIRNILNRNDFYIKEKNFKILVNNKKIIICDTVGYHIDNMTYDNPNVRVLRNIFGLKKINTFEIFNLE